MKYSLGSVISANEKRRGKMLSAGGGEEMGSCLQRRAQNKPFELKT